MIGGGKPTRRPNKIFCVESWSSGMTNRETVKPLLEILEREAGVGYIHRVADDVDVLTALLKRSQRYRKHSIVYLGCHGSPGEIWVGGQPCSLGELASNLGENALPGKTVYFASCATGGDRRALRQFRESVGAEVVCGYADPKGIDWLESAAFDLLLMQNLTGFARGRTGLDHLKKHPSGRALWRALHFVTVPPM